MIGKLVSAAAVAALAVGLSASSSWAASAGSASRTQAMCTPDGTSSCAAVMCAQGYTCVPAPKQCFTTPCPQFDCVPVVTTATPRSGASVVLGVFAQVGSPGTRTVYVRSTPTPMFVRTTRTTAPVLVRTTRTTTQTTGPVVVRTTRTTTQTNQTTQTTTQTTGSTFAGTTQTATQVP